MGRNGSTRRRKAVSFGCYALTAIVVISMVGCTIPRSMHVRDGGDPKYADDYVRFRSTYYFRVYDRCPAWHEASDELDRATAQLYRFQMTGKSSRWNEIHFESGTLMDYEIDPFGSKVTYNKAAGGFIPVSQREAKQAARRAADMAELERLMDLYAKYAGFLEPEEMDDGDTSSQVPGLTDAQRTKYLEVYASLIDAQVAALGSGSGDVEPKTQPIPGSKSLTDFENAVKAEMAKQVAGMEDEDRAELLERAVENQFAEILGLDTDADTSRCPSGQRRFGFRILGPEGWRDFDQDERLLLAMTTSARPLITTMREISSRMVDQRTSAEGVKTRILQEQLHVLESLGELNEADEGSLTEALVGLENRLGGE